MTRINPVNVESATGKAKDLLGAVKSKMGMVPNMMATLANAPATLEGYLGFSGALSHGVLPAKTREAIAITIANANGCDYCLSAHSLLGKGAGLTDADLTAARDGDAADPKLGAILHLAQTVNQTRGKVTDSDLKTARAAGVTDAEILEIVAAVALNAFTNYINNVSDPVIDFPRVAASAGTLVGAGA